MAKIKSSLSHEEKRAKLVNQMRDVRGRILAKASRLPSEHEDDVFLGTWSMKDLLAHLVGWDRTNLAAAKSILKGDLPEFYAHHDPDWSTFNDQLVTKYKCDYLRELIAKARGTHTELIQFIMSIAASELYKDRGIRIKGYKVILARLLQVQKEDDEQHFKEVSVLIKSLPSS